MTPSARRTHEMGPSLGRLAAQQLKLARFPSYLEKGAGAVIHPQLLADFHTVEELG
jgi:hypothetical protein